MQGVMSAIDLIISVMKSNFLGVPISLWSVGIGVIVFYVAVYLWQYFASRLGY